jgi:glycine/D-amino acid oxidase-like deaminating enzyme
MGHDLGPAGSTLRKLADGRFMIRSLYSYEAELPEDRVRRKLLERFHRRYPRLTDVDFEYVWGGVTDITRGGAPFWGQVGPGIFISAGYNGSGVAKGTVLGRKLAEVLAGQTTEQAVSGVLGKAGWLPPEPIRRISVQGTAMVQEFYAGADAT